MQIPEKIFVNVGYLVNVINLQPVRLHACTIWFDFKLSFSWNDLILIKTFTQLDYIMIIVLNYIFPNSTIDIGDLHIKFILLL